MPFPTQTNLWFTRRKAMAAAGTVAGAILLHPAVDAVDSTGKPSKFRYCLNTATIRGYKLPLAEEIDLAAKAGYDSIEPWVSEIDDHARKGGLLGDLRKRAEDRGLTIESAIGFFDWVVDDAERRRAALEEAKRAMGLVRRIGGTRIAAPPSGAVDRSDLPLSVVAERYRALLLIGDEAGVVPQAEIWGFSKTLGRLGDAAMIAIESGHPRACILPDVYHLYRGGSSLESLRLLSGSAFHVFHMNDYPADPPRERLNDSHRLFPGDGVAPFRLLFETFQRIGFTGVLSLEMFPPNSGSRDPHQFAREGLEKMKGAARYGVGAK